MIPKWIKIMPKIAPETAPKTKIGMKIPPGTVAPAAIIVPTYRIIKKRTRLLRMLSQLALNDILVTYTIKA